MSFRIDFCSLPLLELEEKKMKKNGKGVFLTIFLGKNSFSSDWRTVTSAFLWSVVQICDVSIYVISRANNFARDVKMLDFCAENQ
ncbi:MAG: hypothetical protein ACI8RD_000140 [Bacillariaceae sp.]|jgi:hypothetical protein